MNIEKYYLKMDRGPKQTFFFPKKTYRWPTGTGKDVQHHQLSKKYEPNQQ